MTDASRFMFEVTRAAVLMSPLYIFPTWDAAGFGPFWVSKRSLAFQTCFGVWVAICAGSFTLARTPIHPAPEWGHPYRGKVGRRFLVALANPIIHPCSPSKELPPPSATLSCLCSKQAWMCVLHCGLFGICRFYPTPI